MFLSNLLLLTGLDETNTLLTRPLLRLGDEKKNYTHLISGEISKSLRLAACCLRFCCLSCFVGIVFLAFLNDSPIGAKRIYQFAALWNFRYVFVRCVGSWNDGRMMDGWMIPLLETVVGRILGGVWNIVGTKGVCVLDVGLSTLAAVWRGGWHSMAMSGMPG